MTSLAPIAFGAPLIGGLLADALGFRGMFLVALAFGLVGLIMLATLVRDPRHLVFPGRAEEAGA